MVSCQQCSVHFDVLPRDFEYYKRIDVPPPTFCPDCRTQRRFSFRNERHLYHRKCDLSGRQMISMFAPDAPYKVYDTTSWWGDQWDALDYGRPFDFQRPFFEQYAELLCDVPKISLLNLNGHNSDFCNFTGNVKNSYLIFGSVYSEDCYYGSPYYSRDCLDTLVVRECELCYECVDCRKLYHCFYSQDCANSSDLFYCYDLLGCANCIGCVGLRQKNYYIFNQPKTVLEYKEFLKNLDLCDLKQVAEIKKEVAELKLKTIHKFLQSNKAENVSGNYIFQSKNTFHSFYADRCEDCSYSQQVVDLKDCFDNNYTEENELCYEYLGMYSTKNTFFSIFCRHTYDVFYSDYCTNVKYSFGCSGLRNKEYCILNRQYSKEEYLEFKKKIVEHMKKTGEFGQFFPTSISPFAYNETVANEYFPLGREDVLAKGWKWRENDRFFAYQGPVVEFSQNIDQVPDDICDKILTCEVTGKHYKIIPQELRFYRKFHLPLPRCCPDQRHVDRMNLRNPRRLWNRACAKCRRPMETTFAPDRPEIVYCEECYLKEVY